jgi:mono/diheme cytochrome c family protein
MTARRRPAGAAALLLAGVVGVAGIGGVAAIGAIGAIGAMGCQQIFPQRSEGERIWRARCAECHGLDASGNTVRYLSNANADLLDDAWVHGDDDESIETVIRAGVLGEMPPFPMLSDREVRAVIGYLRKLRGEEPGTPR